MTPVHCSLISITLIIMMMMMMMIIIIIVCIYIFPVAVDFMPNMAKATWKGRIQESLMVPLVLS